MRRRQIGLVLIYLAALPAGVASAWWTLRHAEPAAVAVGPWRTSTLAGSAEADLYTRAYVAVYALLALNRAETMYYVARHDSLGAPLRSRCSYRVSGRSPEARWWSVTAYAEDNFLFADAARRYSINGASARLDDAGRFAFVSAPQEPRDLGAGASDMAWLPTPGDRGLRFTLRVYRPGAALRADPRALDAPRIEPIGHCR